MQQSSARRPRAPTATLAVGPSSRRCTCLSAATSRRRTATAAPAKSAQALHAALGAGLALRRPHGSCSRALRAPARADGYARRRPELTTLHRTLSAHWPAFVEQAEAAGGLPSFDALRDTRRGVMREVQDYLRCGLPEHGCALLVCLDCGRGVLVAFSCKHRAFCPSCCGRRMSDASLHLTQCVLPEVPLRHWVCSLPFQLRHLLGYDRELCAKVLNAFVKDL
ncbi:MAG TPA: transposase zinc-binding domain-containing protein [Polyangiales bacterium]